MPRSAQSWSEIFADIIEIGWCEIEAGDVYAVALIGLDGSILSVWDEDTGEELPAWPVETQAKAWAAREARRMAA